MAQAAGLKWTTTRPIDPLELRNAATRRLIKRIEPDKKGQNFFKTIRLSLDGRKVAATVLANQEVRIYDAASGRLDQTLRGHTGHVVDAWFLPDGRVLTSAGDKTVRAWSAVSGKVLHRFIAPGPIDSVVPSPDGQRCTAVWRSKTTGDLGASLLNLETLVEVKRLDYSAARGFVGFARNSETFFSLGANVWARDAALFSAKNGAVLWKGDLEQPPK